jgi:superfamily II DNA or RNA helicase
MLNDEITNLRSYNSLATVLKEDVLLDLQVSDVLRALYRKRAMLLYDTGMGKTIMATAWMKMLLNEDPNRKFLFIAKYQQLAQTPEKIERNLGYSVCATNAEKESLERIFYSGEFKNYKVFIITHNCLGNLKFMQTLFKFRNEYFGIIVDEAHNLSNSNYASSASMLKSMLSCYEYVLALTATPIVSNIDQLAKLANVIDGDTYDNARKLINDLKAGRFSLNNDPNFFISRTREDFGINLEIKGHVINVDPSSHQVGATGQELFLITKGDGAFNQVNRLVKFIKDKEGERGLIYINQHAIREWVIPFLDKNNVKYECINGYTSMAERKEILEKFNVEHEIDVIITSVTEALDLDCNWVMFYEFTVNIAQMIGRATRGFEDRCLDVYFMVTDLTDEVDYFNNHIYNVAKDILRTTGKKYTAVYDAHEQLLDVDDDDWSWED